MTKQKCDGYLNEIQERMDGDVFKAMLELMAQRVMEEELASHVGADRHERTPERRGHRNGYKGRSLNTRVGENSPSRWPTIFSVTNTALKTLPLCTLSVRPTKSGVIIERRDHVLIGVF